jgi:hypothetical protein
MREAHARNPQLRHSAAGQKKKCGHCGEEGHNRKTCPQLLSAAAASAAVAAGRGREAQQATSRSRTRSRSRVILIQEVDADSPLLPAPAAAVAAPAAEAAAAVAGAGAGDEGAITSAVGAASSSSAQPAAEEALAAPAAATRAAAAVAAAAVAAAASRPPAAAAAAVAGTSARGSLEPVRPAAAAVAPPLPARDLVPTLQLVPGMALSPDGDWVLPLPRTKEECVAQAAQVGPAGGQLVDGVFAGLAAHSQSSCLRHSAAS